MVTSVVITILVAVGAYLVGSIPFGYLVARRRGVDIFATGSGNIGATNVGRVLGRRFGILVFLLDFAKGAVPTWAAGQIAVSEDAVGSFLGADGLPVVAGLAAFIGHLYPVYLRFRGGKGVATGAGVVSVLLPLPALAALLTWGVLVLLTRYVSLASLGAALAIVVFRLVLTADPFSATNRTLTWFCFLAAVLVFVRHRSNIVRLIRGTENRLGSSASTNRETVTNPVGNASCHE